MYSYSLGYYKNDYDCGDNIYSYEQQHYHCIHAYDSGGNDGTWNEDDRHVACELAWYIYDNFTSYGEWVNLVAHSLGGVLIKEALYQIYVSSNQYFPPFLYIRHVVTIASPLGGIPRGGSLRPCGGCMQVSQLSSGTNGSIYNDLESSDGQAVGQVMGVTWIMLGQFPGNSGRVRLGRRLFL